MWGDAWRRNLAALWVGQLLSIAGFSFFTPLFPLFIQSLGSYDTGDSVRWAGAMMAISSLAMTVVQPFWGTMADRHGRKPMVLRSMLGSGVTSLFMAFAGSAEQLLVLYTIQGLVSGTVAASTALVAVSMPKQKLGFALGLLHVSIFLGASAGPLAGGIVADAFGFRTPFLAAGALLILGAGIVQLMVQESFTPPLPGQQVRGTLGESRSLLAIALMPVLVGVIFMIQFGNTTLSPVISLFVASLSSEGNQATSVGIVMAAAGVTGAFSAFVVGRMGDRIGHSAVLLVCLAGVAVSYLPQAAVQEVWQLVLLRAVTGAFAGGMMPSANALVATIVPRERRGTAFGLTSSATSFSHAVGPVFGAGVATAFGLRATFLATGMLFAVVCVWALASLRKQEARPGAAEPPSAGGETTLHRA